jgi:hypothetical protein
MIAIKYPQDPQTTMNTANTVPGNLQESIITLYYYLYTMFMMRFTGPRNIPNLPFFSLLCFFFESTEYLLNLLAMKTRQINVLKSPAEMTRQNNLTWQLAGFK